MGTRRRSTRLLRRAALCCTLVLAASTAPYRTGTTDDSAFHPTAFPYVASRSAPAATGGAGQIYVKPGGRAVTRTAPPPVRLLPVPAPGGGEMVVIPPSLYPATRAELGPDGRVRIVCDEPGDHAGHAHGSELAR